MAEFDYAGPQVLVHSMQIGRSAPAGASRQTPTDSSGTGAIQPSADSHRQIAIAP